MIISCKHSLVGFCFSALTNSLISYFRDSVVVSLVNCMTSFFAGFTVFTMMGFMAHLLKTEVGNAVKGGDASGVCY